MLYITGTIVYPGRYGPTGSHLADYRRAAQRAAGVGTAADVDTAGGRAGTDHPAPGRWSEPTADGPPRGRQSAGGVAVGEPLSAGRPCRCQGPRPQAVDRVGDPGRDILLKINRARAVVGLLQYSV